METASQVLEPVARIVSFVQTPLKVPVWPFALVPALHAARISIAYRTNAKTARGGASVGFLQDMTGYLLMCWGGQIIVHLLVGQPLPMLVSATPWIIYPTIHILLGLAGDLVPTQGSLDQAMFGIDALTRQAPIVNAVQLARTSSNLALSESLTGQIVLAALASAGGSAVATTLNVWESDWRFRAPASIRKAATSTSLLLPSLDLWAGALAGAVYSAGTMANPYWAKLFMDLGLRHLLQGAFLTDLEGRAAVVILLSAIYLWRATQLSLTSTSGEKPKRKAVEAATKAKQPAVVIKQVEPKKPAARTTRARAAKKEL